MHASAIHHNPVKHSHARKWQDWLWSSAPKFLETQGEEESRRIRKTYPLGNYGETWDTYVDPDAPPRQAKA